MLTQEQLYHGIISLVPEAKFSFWLDDGREQDWHDDTVTYVKLDGWCIAWRAENTVSCPSLSEIEAAATDGVLNAKRKARINNLLAKRDAIITGGITVGGHTYMTDVQSQNVVLQAITSESLGLATIFPRDWLLANGSTIQVTFDDIKDMAIAFAAKKEACYNNYISLLSQINSSDNPESVDINQGWE